MKLQISFDIMDLQKAISTAQQIAPFCDTIEIGTILIHKYGIRAINEFRNALPKTTLLADSKIVDRGKNAATLFAQAGADWMTVMAGTSNNVIHAVCTTAKANGSKVVLDLLDAAAPGQSAMEAKDLGVDSLLFHRSHDETGDLEFLDNWEMIRGNTKLPIYISAKINRKNIDTILELKPDGIVMGTSIMQSDDPVAEARFFYELVNK